MTSPPPWIDAAELGRLMPVADAVDVLERALLGGLDPSADPPRAAVGTASGQLLLMPAETPAGVGVKITSVAPANPARGLPRIQAIYVLMDAGTLTPVALLDGTALTVVRTAAVSALAVRRLAAPDAARLVVFGSGPQAEGHVRSLRAVRPVREVTVVGRDRARATACADRVAAPGLETRAGSPEDVADADLVVCATTARSPLFDGALVRNEACVVAVGSHEPDARELDAGLLARGTVVVEERAAALREAGDVVLAISEGRLDGGSLVALADLVTGAAEVPSPRAPRIFKSVGMSWQDLVVATEVHRRRHAAAR
jgi:ornithine cyclodeaminase/alanine dehydrogenase-like protein (mu-crystallin family)